MLALNTGDGLSGRLVVLILTKGVDDGDFVSIAAIPCNLDSQCSFSFTCFVKALCNLFNSLMTGSTRCKEIYFHLVKCGTNNRKALHIFVLALVGNS